MSELNFYDIVREGRYLILDTETTGLRDAEIVQIAIMSVDNDMDEIVIDTLIKPTKPIPPDATRIHGITDEMVKDSPSWATLAPQIMEILRDRDLVIYNAAFDTAVMESASRHARVQWEATWASVHCAMEAFAEHYGDWNDYHQSYKWQPLSKAAQYVGMQPDNAHNALSDCKMTLAVCKFLATVKEEADGGESDYKEWDDELFRLDDEDYTF